MAEGSGFQPTSSGRNAFRQPRANPPFVLNHHQMLKEIRDNLKHLRRESENISDAKEPDSKSISYHNTTSSQNLPPPHVNQHMKQSRLPQRNTFGEARRGLEAMQGNRTYDESGYSSSSSECSSLSANDLNVGVQQFGNMPSFYNEVRFFYCFPFTDTASSFFKNILHFVCQIYYRIVLFILSPSQQHNSGYCVEKNLKWKSQPISVFVRALAWICISNMFWIETVALGVFLAENIPRAQPQRLPDCAKNEIRMLACFVFGSGILMSRGRKKVRSCRRLGLLRIWVRLQKCTHTVIMCFFFFFRHGITMKGCVNSWNNCRNLLHLLSV